MTTAIIQFTATAELNLDSDTFPPGMTSEEKLAYWMEGAKNEPLIALACVDAEWKIEGELK